jgi:heat shock protein HslJ
MVPAGAARRTVLLAGVALSAACSTAVQEPDAPVPKPAGPLEPLAARCGDQRPFVATGTEPGWRLTLSAATLDLDADYGTTRVSLPTPAPRQRDGAVIYSGEGAGHAVALAVRDDYCTNAMSGKPFPCTVSVTLDGDRVDGCGGAPASLLTGPAWQIGSLAGEPLPADVQPTLRFESDGAVTGFDGCNHFRGRYRITGVGVRFAELASTRMACTGSRGDVAGKLYAALDGVRLFRLADGHLILASHGEARLTAQR